MKIPFLHKKPKDDTPKPVRKRNPKPVVTRDEARIKRQQAYMNRLKQR